MKKILVVITMIFLSAQLLAQKQADRLPDNKEKLDSLLAPAPKLYQPFATPHPKEFSTPFQNNKPNSFEAINPGTSLLYKTSKGSVYKMPLDNMAVLVPAMNGVERMPGNGSSNKYREMDKMPNPFYPKNKQ